MIHYWPQFFSVSDEINGTAWMSLDCSKIQALLRIVRIQAILKPFFLSVLHLLPELISIFLSTNAEHWQSPPSSRLTNIQCRLIAFCCIHQQLGRDGRLNQVLAKLLDCVVMNFDTWKQVGSLDSCVSMSIHCHCSIGKKSQPLVDDGFNIGLAFAAGFPKLSLPLGSAWLLWQICQYRSQFESKIRFDLGTKIEPELQYCILRSDCKLLCPRRDQIAHCFGSTLWYEFLLDLEAS